MNTNKESPMGQTERPQQLWGCYSSLERFQAYLALLLGNPFWMLQIICVKISANEEPDDHRERCLIYHGRCLCRIGLALYPILKKYNEGLAIGAVGFRIIEGVFDIVARSLLSLPIGIKPGICKSWSSGRIVFSNRRCSNQRRNRLVDPWGHAAVLVHRRPDVLFVFYQYRLVPRWLSVWGLVGITLVTIGSVLVMLHVIPGFGTVQMVFNLPIFPQEMVLAVWLIVKGINPSAVASGLQNSDERALSAA